MPNPLLESQLPLQTWMSKLSGVSAKLYETSIDVWERFEPESKRLQETLSFLDYEGALDLRTTTASEGLRVLSAWNPGHGEDWRNVADAAERALKIRLNDLL